MPLVILELKQNPSLTTGNLVPEKLKDKHSKVSEAAIKSRWVRSQLSLDSTFSPVFDVGI
jgi:hypothetical protein